MVCVWATGNPMPKIGMPQSIGHDVGRRVELFKENETKSNTNDDFPLSTPHYRLPTTKQQLPTTHYHCSTGREAYHRSHATPPARESSCARRGVQGVQRMWDAPAPDPCPPARLPRCARGALLRLARTLHSSCTGWQTVERTHAGIQNDPLQTHLLSALPPPPSVCGLAKGARDRAAQDRHRSPAWVHHMHRRRQGYTHRPEEQEVHSVVRHTPILSDKTKPKNRDPPHRPAWTEGEREPESARKGVLASE
jgi:hypothetical protein